MGFPLVRLVSRTDPAVIRGEVMKAHVDTIADIYASKRRGPQE